MPTPSYSLFCLGHPLLDMQVRNGEKLLQKYKLKANDAIRAGEQHGGLYEELVREHQVTYVAGGAAQNAARGAAYILPPKSVVYTGAIGDDDLAEKLKEANEREGLDQVYLVKKGEKTGACGVIITGHHRSLVTTLRAARQFEKSHLLSPEVAPLIDGAKYFYIEGYILTHDVESALELSSKAAASGKTFILNFSAPFICQSFGTQLLQVLPYTDIIIGNETEAEAWASTNGYSNPRDLPGIACTIALLPKFNTSRPRVVVFTQGAQHTVLVTSDKPNEPRIFLVDALTDDQIIDTNGAGDAFAGGFIGGLVAGKKLDEAILSGHALARACVQEIGPQYPWPKIVIP